jgi:hypothetical protein
LDWPCHLYRPVFSVFRCVVGSVCGQDKNSNLTEDFESTNNELNSVRQEVKNLQKVLKAVKASAPPPAGGVPAATTARVPSAQQQQYQQPPQPQPSRGGGGGGYAATAGGYADEQFDDGYGQPAYVRMSMLDRLVGSCAHNVLQVCWSRGPWERGWFNVRAFVWHISGLNIPLRSFSLSLSLST